MPTLAELKSKWFLPMSGDVLGVPQARVAAESTGTITISISTDGNHVTPLIDGQNYFARWDLEIKRLAGGADELYHSGWRVEGVPIGGKGTSPDALDDMKAVKTAGGTPYLLASEHVPMQPKNLPSVDWLRINNVWTACLDNRYPAAGSNHQKMSVFKCSTGDVAMLGSIDLAKSRWDTTGHTAGDPLRLEKPTHDTGVAITGPALADLDLCFRERWNDSTRTIGMTPLAPKQPLIATRAGTGSTGGTHSIQVLRTYGITSAFFGYSWSPVGEFTVWASYLNAITRATRYIYIEDQYFLPWSYPPRFSLPAGPKRDCDIVFQLGEAMKRGVTVVVLTPSNAEDAWHVFQKFQRDLGVNYLTDIRAAGSPGDVIVASLQNGTQDVYVHSKLMLVDDELMLIGSANICQRSASHDGEIHVAVVDSAGTLAKEFRKSLWAEHSGRAGSAFDDPVAGITQFKADMLASAGHLKPYPSDPASRFVAGGPPPPTIPIKHAAVMRNGIDPYAGPPALA